MDSHYSCLVKKRAQAKKNAAAAKLRSGKESSTTNPESDVSSAHVQDVGHNSSPVQLDGGRVARFYARPGVEASQFPLGGLSSSRGVMERNFSEATTQTVCGLDWSIKDTNWPELGGPGDVCTVCGDKLQDKEFVDETCVQLDHVKDRNKTTHQMCYFCSHDKLRILANNLKRDIQA